jgi:hypothetical protein
MSDVLNQKVEAYYEARRDYEEKKRVATEAEKHRRRLEAELVDYMLEHKIKAVDRADGTKPLLAKNVSFSVTKDNFDAIREWLVEQVGDDKDFIETTVSKSAVGELVKTKIEKEKWDESDFPAELKVSTRPGLRVTGWKSLDGADGE